MLICVVEEWSSIGEPSVPARLAQIRALMDLRAFDRAWTRLQPLIEPGESAEIFRLSGGLLLQRGEVKNARAALTRGRRKYPEDDAIRELLDETEEPGTVIDVTDPMEDDPDGQAELAGRLLIEGAPLKARRILERILKSDPNHSRSADLIWALDGDFRLRGVTLADLARVHAAPTQSLADLPEDSDLTAEADHTIEEVEHAAFPTLFKNLEEQTESYNPPSTDEEPEVTCVSSIVSEAGESAEVTQEVATREDTQIMHVVRTTGHQPDSAAVDTLVDGAFDLRAHEMSLGGESEDENVIVRRKAPAERTITETDAGERIRLDPSRDRVQQGANVVDEGADFIRPRKKPQVTVEPAPPKPAPPVPELAQLPSEDVPTLEPVAQSTLAPPPTPEPVRPDKPRLTAAPSEGPPPPPLAVPLQRIPTAERPRIDPAMAAAPTEILEDPDFPRARSGLAPWTGWLLVLVLFGLIVLSMGSLLILYQVVTSM